MLIGNIDYKAPKYSPRKARDYFKENNIDRFISSIVIESIEDFKKFDDLSNEKEKFILNLNNFHDKFNKILSLASEMSEIIISLNNDYKDFESVILDFDFNEINSKIKLIFDLAVKYEKNFLARRFIPKFNGEYFCCNCMFSDYPIKELTNFDDKFEKYLSLAEFINDYDFFIKNFINLIYADSIDAEEFLNIKFEDVMNDYNSVISAIDTLNKNNKLNSFEQGIKNLHLKNEEILNLFNEQPATIVKLYVDFYCRAKGLKVNLEEFNFYSIDYFNKLSFLKNNILQN